jgi:hypothetical protein
MLAMLLRSAAQALCALRAYSWEFKPGKGDHMCVCIGYEFSNNFKDRRVAGEGAWIRQQAAR